MIGIHLISPSTGQPCVLLAAPFFDRAGQNVIGILQHSLDLHSMTENIVTGNSDNGLKTLRVRNQTVNVQDTINTLIANIQEFMTFIADNIGKDYEIFLQVAEGYKIDAATFNQLTSEAANMGQSILMAINEVSIAINEIATTINQSAEGTNEIAQEINETSKSVLEINTAAESLSNMAKHLMEASNKFRI